jgi:hyperosmotically inducible protein
MKGETIMKKNAMRISSIILAMVFTILLGVLGDTQTFAANKVADHDITYWVKNALRHDERIGASEITVKSQEGIVTLSGKVKNLAAKRYAALEAKKINGVLSVINKIEVKPSYRRDMDITHDVRRRILNSAVIESQGIRVTCMDGKVTLSGKVATWSEAQEARLLASEVRGVKDVKNGLWAEHKGKRNDQEIKDDAVAAIESDVYLSGLPITVSVKDGTVTLEGSVGSAYERDRASSDLFWISHVKGVENNLKVEWWENKGVRKKTPAPSDDALKKEVQATLNRDTRVDKLDISIKASYGHVTLDGSVPDRYQKRVAGQDVRDVVGVGWVTNNLFVRADLREDWAIRDDVKFNLNTDYSLNGFDIGVKVKNAVVTLSGGTHTWHEKFHAEDVASHVRGVKRVINTIKVDWERRYSDAALTKEVKSRLKWNWTTHPVYDKIDVTVKNGVAILDGEVNRWSERREAGHVALHTEGIWTVDNRLTVHGYDYPWEEWHTKGPYAYDPLYNPYDNYNYDSPWW